MKSLQRFTHFGATCGVAAVLLGAAGGVIAQQAEATSEAASGSESALLRMLARVPDVPGNLGEIYFNDRRAIEAAYPPAQMPADYAEFMAMSDAAGEDAAYTGIDLWWLVWRGNSTSVLSQNLGVAEDMPAAVGFDLFDVERELTYGVPPYTGAIVEGQFDPAAVQSVFEGQDYDALQEVGDFELLCPAAGCDTGINQNLSVINRANPFGGDLGRQQPLLVSADTIISSTNLNALIAVANGNRPSLAESASYAAAVGAVEAEGVLLQAYFWDFDLIQALSQPLDPSILARNTPSQAQEQIAQMLENFEELPSFSLLMFADVATETEQVAFVGLVYADEAEAQAAADVIPRRIDDYTSMAINQPLRDILAERGVEAVETEVVNTGERFVTLVRFATPKATPEQIVLLTPTNENPPDVAPPSILFRFLVSSAQRRDIGWLNTATREQLEALVGE